MSDNVNELIYNPDTGQWEYQDIDTAQVTSLCSVVTGVAFVTQQATVATGELVLIDGASDTWGSVSANTPIEVPCQNTTPPWADRSHQHCGDDIVCGTVSGGYVQVYDGTNRGVVPLGGDASTYLRGDGTWGTPASEGALAILRELSGDWQGTFTTVAVNSSDWQNTFLTVLSQSALWVGGGSDVSTISANWQNTFSTVLANSAFWGSHTDVATLSSNWQNTWTTVLLNSSFWNEHLDISPLTADWQHAFTIVQSNSAFWQSVYLHVLSNSSMWVGGGSDVSTISANWQNTFLTVLANSALWANHTDLTTLSGDWDSVYSTVLQNSSFWQSVYTTVTNNSALWVGTGSDVSTISANWQNTFSTVLSNSAFWGSHLNISSLTSDWQNTFLTMQTNSAFWQSVYAHVLSESSSWIGGGSDVSTISSNWQNTWVTVLSNSATWGSHTIVHNLTGNWQSTFVTVNNTSAYWDTVYATVLANSSIWGSHTDITLLSSNWQNTWVTTAALSSYWQTVYTVVAANSSIWGNHSDVTLGNSAYSTVNSNSAKWNQTFSTVNTNSASWAGGGGGSVTINNYSSIGPPQLFNPTTTDVASGFGVFTVPTTHSIALVTLNGQVLDDSEYSLVSTSLTATPDVGFEGTDDELLVYQHTFATGGTGLVLGVTQVTTNYSVSANDYTIIVDATTGIITITLPTAADNVGRILNIKKIDATGNNVVVDGNTTELIDGGSTATITTQYQSITVHCDGSQWWIL